MGKVAVGIGELLWDRYPSGDVLGGAPANFAYHASQLGLSGYIASAIGAEDEDRVLYELKQKQLNHLLGRVAFPTGTVDVTVDEKGVPTYAIARNAAWDSIAYTAQLDKLALACSAVCFGTLAQRCSTSREAIARFIDRVPHTAYKVFDVNLRQHFYSKELIHQSLAKCNILKVNDAELRVVAGLWSLAAYSEEELCQMLLNEYSLHMLILTKGAGGSYVYTRERCHFCAAPSVQVVDTVGAGDSFTAAFVAALLSNQPAERAHRLAASVAAYVCTQKGAMPALPIPIVNALKVRP